MHEDLIVAPGEVDLGDELSAQLKFGPWQYGLLAVLLVLVAAITAVGLQSHKNVGRDTEALHDQLRFVSGNVVTLERQAITHALMIERWIDGVASEDDLLVSSALVERQRRITADEAENDPELQPLMERLDRTLEEVDALVAQGRPTPQSAEDLVLDAVIDKLVAEAKLVFDAVEARNLTFVDAVEDRLQSSRQTELVVAGLIVLLGLTLIGSMQKMVRTNYEIARTSLRREHDRFQQARAKREQVEQRLVQAQKLESVGQLAAGIAHEINTPMQYIGDNTHFLKSTVSRLLAIGQAAEEATAEDASAESLAKLKTLVEKSKLPILTERAPKAADDALAGVDNVSRIVTAMKRFSHPGSDQMEPVDLNDSITTTVTVCRNEWKYSADMAINIDPDLPPIEGWLGPLNQVWLNLVVNASHAIVDRHGDNKGLITISAATVNDGNDVQITIEDNGAGISAEHQSRIFDHFFTTKAVGKGTGQGLAIAYQAIVADHNGSISVDSTPGQGTVFTIVLPVSQPALVPAS